ncbi:hypothetical protein OHA70_18105 [Kribbella sp. NBC_00382]|uniref:ETEC_3214 domain-containing protein n=1 Tax=Kribbella sp. NBC_00382 TaxID=2975967 RepID=UPI002E22DF58
MILGVPPLAWRSITRGWRNSIGSARAQSQLLDRLACGESIDRVNSWLGLPVHSTTDRLHTYELPGAWVHIAAGHGVVTAFAITIRSPRMAYATSRRTAGRLNVKLGQSTFGALARQLPVQEEKYEEGARRFGYSQMYYFGSPGHYQHYVLAHNQAGCGDLGGGLHLAGADDPGKLSGLATTTVNTLMVYAPHLAPPKELSGFAGVDVDLIRVRMPLDELPAD